MKYNFAEWNKFLALVRAWTSITRWWCDRARSIPPVWSNKQVCQSIFTSHVPCYSRNVPFYQDEAVWNIAVLILLIDNSVWCHQMAMATCFTINVIGISQTKAAVLHKWLSMKAGKKVCTASNFRDALVFAIIKNFTFDAQSSGQGSPQMEVDLWREQRWGRREICTVTYSYIRKISLFKTCFL